MDRKHGVGRSAEVLVAYKEMDVDIIGLQEAPRSGHSSLLIVLNMLLVMRLNYLCEREHHLNRLFMDGYSGDLD